jgi:hypothetical protein
MKGVEHEYLADSLGGGEGDTFIDCYWFELTLGAVVETRL